MSERPIITVREWATLRGIPDRTAKSWAASGHLSGAYQSGGTWLIPTSTPSPGPMLTGRAAHRPKD